MSDAARPRTIALVGPYLSGKTAVLESILFTTGALNRKGSAKEGNTVGDASAEARERQMGVELNVASAAFMGDSFHFLDAPGSVEFSQEAFDAVLGADLVVVVCEPDIERARAVAPVIKLVEQRGLPSLFFINKIDRLQGPVAAVVEALQEASGRALALRQLPIVDGETVAGYVDLASGRGYRYQPHEASAGIDPPAAMAEEIENARFAMLEKMADFDDGLMETLLEDDDPSSDDVFGNLSRMVAAGDIAPVMLGAAELDHGVQRLLKALRHDAPTADATAARLGLDAQGSRRDLPGAQDLQPAADRQAVAGPHLPGTARGGRPAQRRPALGPVRDDGAAEPQAAQRVDGRYRRPRPHGRDRDRRHAVERRRPGAAAQGRGAGAGLRPGHRRRQPQTTRSSCRGR